MTQLLTAIQGVGGGGGGGVALTVGSVPRRIVSKLKRHFHWLLKMSNQLNLRVSGTILCGADSTVSATAAW